MSPELYSKQVISEKTDIYSLGIVFWELATSGIPYEGVPAAEAATRAAREGARPTIPASVPAKWRELIQSCWDGEPDKRPSAADVLIQLGAIADAAVTEAETGVLLDMSFLEIGGKSHSLHSISLTRSVLTLCVWSETSDNDECDKDGSEEDERREHKRDASWSSVLANAFTPSRKRSKAHKSNTSRKGVVVDAPTMKKSPSLTNLNSKEYSSLLSSPISSPRQRKPKKPTAFTLDALIFSSSRSGSSGSGSGAISPRSANGRTVTLPAPPSALLTPPQSSVLPQIVSSPIDSAKSDPPGGSSDGGRRGSDTPSAVLQLDLLELVNQPEFHDVQFVVGAQRQVFYAHKAIVCARSPHLSALIVNSSNSDRFELLDLNEHGFLYALQYLYSGQFPSCEALRYYQLMDVANRLGLDALVRRCMAHLADNLMEPPDSGIEVREPDTSANLALAKISEIDEDLRAMDHTMGLLMAKLKALP